MGGAVNPRAAFRAPRAAQVAGVALLAAAIAGLALWSALPTPGSRMLGIGGVDHSGTLWVNEQVREALTAASAGAASLVHTPVFYYPWGQDMLHNTGINVVDALLAAPFSLLGRVAGHNAFLLCVLGANGLAAMRYASHHTEDRTAAALAGLAFAIAPYPPYELLEGQPAQELLVGMVFYLRALTRAVHGTGSPWTAALWLALLGYQYWFYAVFAALGTVAGGVAWAARPPVGRSTAAVIGALLRVAAGAAVCVAPVVVPMLTAMYAGSVPGLIGQTPDMLLHSYQPARGMVSFFDDGQFIGSQRALPLALAVAALARTRKRAGPDPDRVPELLIGAVALLLAMGPTLMIIARTVPEPLYVALSAALPPSQRLWHPARALAMLAVLGIGWFARMRRPAPLLLLALGVIAAVRDGLLPFPTWDPTLPAGYQCLSARSGEADHAALLELRLAGSQRHLGYQSVHHRPISGGMHEAGATFQAAEAVEWRASDPYANGLYALARGAAPKAPLGDGAAVHALGYGYVVLQKDGLPTGQTAGERTLRRRIEGSLEGALGAPIWDDARTTVWAPWGDPLPCSVNPPARDETPAEPLQDRAVKYLLRYTEVAGTTPGRIRKHMDPPHTVLQAHQGSRYSSSNTVQESQPGLSLQLFDRILNERVHKGTELFRTAKRGSNPKGNRPNAITRAKERSGNCGVGVSIASGHHDRLHAIPPSRGVPQRVDSSRQRRVRVPDPVVGAGHVRIQLEVSDGRSSDGARDGILYTRVDRSGAVNTSR